MRIVSVSISENGNNMKVLKNKGLSSHGDAEDHSPPSSRPVDRERRLATPDAADLVSHRKGRPAPHMGCRPHTLGIYGTRRATNRLKERRKSRLEQPSFNQLVAGSNPARPTILKACSPSIFSPVPLNRGCPTNLVFLARFLRSQWRAFAKPCFGFGTYVFLPIGLTRSAPRR